MAPVEHWDVQIARQDSCIFAQSALCVTEDRDLEIGNILCFGCKQTNPLILIDRLNDARGHTIMDEKYSEWMPIIVKKWEREDAMPRQCAWRQLRFRKTTSPDAAVLLKRMKEARLKDNQDKKRSDRKTNVDHMPCMQVDTDTEVCEYCEAAKEKFGSVTLRGLFSDGKHLSPRFIERLIDYDYRDIV